MNRKLIFFFLLILAGWRGHASDWIQTLPLTDKILVLYFDDGYIQHYGYHQQSSACVTFNSPLDISKAMLTGSYTISSPDDASFAGGVQPVSVGRKSKGQDFSRKCLWRQSVLYNECHGGATICDNDFIFEHFVYLELPHALQQGKKYVITLSGLATNYNSDTLVFDVTRVRSDAVHVNQIGFLPDAEKKYGYLSAWMGDKGPLDLDDYAGSRFHLIDLSTGQAVFEGTIAKRLDVETAQQKDLPGEPGSPFFSMSDVWECDFSSFTTPGEYVLSVEKIGCSYPFKIGRDIYREAFYHTVRQLYHARTGIALTEPYTKFTRPRTCHPADGKIRFKYTRSKWTDWHSENGDMNTVLSLVDTSVHLTTWGWYQDAGDWDGYYSHTAVPRYLMSIYELYPEKFHDGELNIPESGNGIPDILDEARWLIDYFDRTRGPSGGIAGARIHPDFEDIADGVPSWEDTRNWIISGEDVVTTYTFAGMCAQLAWCYKISGNNTLASSFISKAESAFDWAESHKQQGEDLHNARLYASAWLYKYIGAAVFQNIFKQDYINQSSAEYASENFRWAVYAFATCNQGNIDANQKTTCINQVKSIADADVVDPATKRSFRAGFNWTYPMLVGQATTPMVFPAVVAYKITGDKKYLTAIETTVDYFMGGNPLNMLWMTGYGDHHPEQVMHLDTWFSNRDEFIPGIIPYGPTYIGRDWMPNNGPWASEFALCRVYPSKELWPGHEMYFENRYCPPTNEFTIHQNTAPAAAVLGFLCDTASGQWAPNEPPSVIFTGPDKATLQPGSTVMFTVQVSDNDGYVTRVEYFNNKHKIGQSAAPPFSFTWKNLPSGPYAIEAVVYDNEGARGKSVLGQTSAPAITSNDGTGLKVFPNPGHNMVYFEFDVEKPSDAVCSIYSADGKLVRSWNVKNLAHGLQRLAFNLSELPLVPGQYLCAVDTTIPGNKRKLAWLIIQ